MKTLRTYDNGAGRAKLVHFRDLDEKLRKMRSMIGQARENPIVRAKAVEILHLYNVTPRDKKAQALACAAWVQDNIYYVHEYPERLTHAFKTLEQGAGDCDDFTILIGGLIETIGIPCAQVCMKINGEYKHIFPAAILHHQKYASLLPLDSTMKVPVQNVHNPISWAMDRGKQVLIKLA